MQRIPLRNRWTSERWQPLAVVPASAQPADIAAPRTAKRVADDASGNTWRFAGYAIELYRTEAEGYFLNLSTANPAVFVLCRPAAEGQVPPLRPELVTVSYHEAARMLDAGEQVDPVPMPFEIAHWLHPFMAEHYKPEPRRKVRRNDPFAHDEPPRG